MYLFIILCVHVKIKIVFCSSLNVQYRLKLVRVNNQRGLLESVNYACRKDPGRRLADSCTMYKLGSCFLIFMFTNPDGCLSLTMVWLLPHPTPSPVLCVACRAYLSGEGGEEPNYTTARKPGSISYSVDNLTAWKVSDPFLVQYFPPG